MPLRKIAVCVKQIPLIEDASFDPVTKTIRRDGPTVMGSFDLNAVAYAVELAQQFGAQTTSITMGPPQAQSSLIETMAMGIDRAVHLQDRAFAGSDTLATARALALWLKREAFDLILLGKYSLDAETGQVGPEIAELLGIAQITGIRNLTVEGEIVRAAARKRRGHGGDRMPAAGAAHLRRTHHASAAAAARRPGSGEIQTSDYRSVPRNWAATADQFGFAGSPTWVQGVQVQQAPSVQCKLIDAADSQRAAQQVVAELDRLGALSCQPPRTAKNRRPRCAPPRPARTCGWCAKASLECEITRGSLELLSAGDELGEQAGRRPGRGRISGRDAPSCRDCWPAMAPTAS